VKTLRDVMTTQLYTCAPQDPVAKAAQIMRDHNVGAVPIVDQQGGTMHLLGMITDRDICIRCVALNKPNSTPCSEVMSDRKLVAGTPNMTVDEASRLMAREKIRRLPVVDNQKLVGIVSLGDLAVREPFVDEAAEALQDISEPARPM